MRGEDGCTAEYGDLSEDYVICEYGRRLQGRRMVTGDRQYGDRCEDDDSGKYVDSGRDVGMGEYCDMDGKCDMDEDGNSGENGDSGWRL